MRRIIFYSLVVLAVFTLVCAPSLPPARPEPGAAAIVGAVFEGER